MSIQPSDPAARPPIQIAARERRARRRDDAVIQAELRRLAQLAAGEAGDSGRGLDREDDSFPDRAA